MSKAIIDEYIAERDDAVDRAQQWEAVATYLAGHFMQEDRTLLLTPELLASTLNYRVNASGGPEGLTITLTDNEA